MNMRNSLSADWIEQLIEVQDGFPRPDWDAIAGNIETTVDKAQRNEMWDMVVEEWLGGIIEVLGDEYWLGVSNNFYIVTSSSEENTNALARFLEDTLTKIPTSLKGIASNEGYGKHVVIVFDSQEQYYSYISYFYPEQGEFSGSSGIYINKGYGHFALPSISVDINEMVVAHELTHACLAHLPLPAWLNERITTTMEHEITHAHPLIVDSETMDRHRRFWGHEEIQQFWSGQSFHRPDEGSELSYHLARLVVGAISHDYNLFKEFVLLADYQDGGEAAAQEVFGGSLGGLMERFLGLGVWTPDPETWAEVELESLRRLQDCC